MLSWKHKEKNKKKTNPNTQINLKEYLTVLNKSWQELESCCVESMTYDLTSGKEKTEEGNAFMWSLACLWFMLIIVYHLINAKVCGKKTLSSSSGKQTEDPSNLSEPYSNKHNDAKAQTPAITTVWEEMDFWTGTRTQREILFQATLTVFFPAYLLPIINPKHLREEERRGRGEDSDTQDLKN